MKRRLHTLRSMPRRATAFVSADTTVVAVPGCSGTGIELLLILPL
jgi:hypothetical protein